MSQDNQQSKSTKAEITKRVNQVYNLLLMGFSRAEILEYGQKVDPKKHKTAWNVADNTIDTYISKANEIFKLQSAIHRDEQFGLAISRLIYLWQKNVSIQDYKTALAVQREINLLLGLYPPKDTKLNINIAIIQQFIAVAQSKGYDPSEIVADFIAELAPIEIANDATDSNQTD